MPEPSRRKDLPNVSVTSVQHAGLWLDRYLKTQSKDDADARTVHIDKVTTIAVPKCYVTFYERWKQSLEAMYVGEQQYKVQTREAEVQGRMIVGLGAESVLETAVTLHHTYGVPYIPGSALKGLAAAYAHQRLDGDGWRKGGDYHKIMFGTTDTAGYITFFDALYMPGTGVGGRPLPADVMAIHHKPYYDGTGQPPADWDSPIIVPFLSATGKYLIALAGPFAWVSKAFEILGDALKDMGIGAKTSSGYGRMHWVEEGKQGQVGLSQTASLQNRTEQASRDTQQSAGQPSSQPRTTGTGPKMGQDLWGTIVDREGKHWIIKLDSFGVEVRASAPQNLRPRIGIRAFVRITDRSGEMGQIRRLG